MLYGVWCVCVLKIALWAFWCVWQGVTLSAVVWSLCLVWCCHSLCGSLWSSLAVGAVWSGCVSLAVSVALWWCCVWCLLSGGVVSGLLWCLLIISNTSLKYTYTKRHHTLCAVSSTWQYSHRSYPISISLVLTLVSPLSSWCLL